MFGRTKKHLVEIDTRELLLRTSERLFAQYGFDGVSLRMLQTACGVNIAMIAYYFGSKAGLFDALLEERFPVIREKLEQIQAEEISNWEKMNKTIEIYIERMFQHVDFAKIIFRELSIAQRPEQSQRILHYIQKNSEIIKSFLADGIANGEFRSVDIEMTLSTLFSSIFQWINMSTMMEQMLHLGKGESVYNSENKLRLKNHLADLLFRHLNPENN